MHVRSLPATLDWHLPRITWMVPWLFLPVLAVLLTYEPKAGTDAAVYWSVGWPPDYSATDITATSYHYTPAFAFWVQPLTLIPWPLFYLLVTGASMTALAYLVGPWLAVLLVVVKAPILYDELVYGNVNLIIGALVVLGLTRTGPWPFMLLTKVTPGVGLIWFAVRREWRTVGVIGGLTVTVALPSLLFAPGAWVAWFGAMLETVEPAENFRPALPLIVRWPLAAGIVAYAAWTDHKWLVPLAVVIATPVNYLSWVMVLGAVRLYLRAPRMPTL